MKIGTFLLELMIVLAIVGVLYYVYLDKTKTSILNDNDEVITKDVKEILDETSKISLNNNDENTKKEIEQKVNKLMKKYNIN